MMSEHDDESTDAVPHDGAAAQESGEDLREPLGRVVATGSS